MLGTQWEEMPGYLSLIFIRQHHTMGITFFFRVFVFLFVMPILLRSPTCVFYYNSQNQAFLECVHNNLIEVIGCNILRNYGRFNKLNFPH